MPDRGGGQAADTSTAQLSASFHSSSSSSSASDESPVGLPQLQDVIFFLNLDLPSAKTSHIRSLLIQCGAREWDAPANWRQARRMHLDAAHQSSLIKRAHSSSDRSGKVAFRPPASPGEINPAWRFDPDVVTHVITTTINFPEYDACGDPMADGTSSDKEQGHATVVSPGWVFRSHLLGIRQPERYYSPDPAFIFSGIVVHPSRLSASETELILAAVTSLGGHFRMNLTKEVTHVITPAEDSVKLRALRQPEHQKLGILAVHPAWINECIKLNHLVDPTPFSWPLTYHGLPAYLQSPPCSDGPDKIPPNTQLNKPNSIQEEEEAWKNMTDFKGFERPVFSTLVPKKHYIHDLFTQAPEANKRPRFYRHRDAFQGLKILFVGEESACLSNGMVEILSYNVRDHGGIWIPLPPHGSSLPQAVARADVVVVGHRDVPAAYLGLYMCKRLATVSWLWWVTTYGRLVEPMDHVLHYPPPSKPISQFDKYSFSLSNYTGEARAYLKELLSRAGGHWTPEFTCKNTHLIAAVNQGAKVAHAGTWGIKVANHLWLEDCYATWTNIPLDRSSAYTDLVTTVPLQDILGHAAVDRASMKRWEDEACEWVEHRAAQEGFVITDGLRRPRLCPTHPVSEELNQRKVASPEAHPSPNDGTHLSYSRPSPANQFHSLNPQGSQKFGQDKTASQNWKAQGKPGQVQEQNQDREHNHNGNQDEKDVLKRMQPRVSSANQILKPDFVPDVSPQPPRSKRKRGRAGTAKEDTPAHGPSPTSAETRRVLGRHSSEETEPLAPGSKSPRTATDAVVNPMPTRSNGKKSVRKEEPLRSGRSTTPLPSQENGVGLSARSARYSPTAGGLRLRSKFYATTGIDLTSAQEKGLRRRGWVRSQDVGEHTALLVASTLTRTEKMLCAIARGIRVVRFQWVEAVLQATSPSTPQESALADLDAWLLHDRQAEVARKVSLRSSLARRLALGHGLLQGHTFYFTAHVKPNAQTLRAIVSAAGGEAPPARTVPKDTLLSSPQMYHLVSHNEDRALWSDWKRERCADGLKVCVWNAELLLDGILRQKMRWDRNKLLG